MLDESSEYILSIDRSTPDIFWRGVISFYKGALENPSKLQQVLVVNFVNTGESGSDCGALKKEFFEDAIQAINDRLFEGEQDRRIPRKDLSLELQFQVAGMLIAHSLLQQGPGMPCLSPSIYNYLVYGDPTLCYPTVEDIPLNISTYELITVIEKVSIAHFASNTMYIHVYSGDQKKVYIAIHNTCVLRTCYCAQLLCVIYNK